MGIVEGLWMQVQAYEIAFGCIAGGLVALLVCLSVVRSR
jgi:hypothetical protein